MSEYIRSKDPTGQHPRECPMCYGFGQTPNARTLVNRQPDGTALTTQLGSGCPRCLGTGRLEN